MDERWAEESIRGMIGTGRYIIELTLGRRLRSLTRILITNTEAWWRGSSNLGVSMHGLHTRYRLRKTRRSGATGDNSILRLFSACLVLNLQTTQEGEVAVWA